MNKKLLIGLIIISVLSLVVFAQECECKYVPTKDCPNGGKTYLIYLEGPDHNGAIRHQDGTDASVTLRRLGIQPYYTSIVYNPYNDNEAISNAKKALKQIKNVATKCDTTILVINAHGSSDGIYMKTTPTEKEKRELGDIAFLANNIAKGDLIDFMEGTQGKKFIFSGTCGSGAFMKDTIDYINRYSTKAKNTLFISATGDSEPSYTQCSVFGGKTTFLSVYFQKLLENCGRIRKSLVDTVTSYSGASSIGYSKDLVDQNKGLKFPDETDQMLTRNGLLLCRSKCK
ncbi:MAG: hypothetical protein HY831_00555 [Candidatus Aenigmarchaeota archaeon]|nr:hypothetical protein [Candidatus Aenigmarchaeota archaeon]